MISIFLVDYHTISISSDQIIDVVVVGPRKTIYEENYRIIKNEQ